MNTDDQLELLRSIVLLRIEQRKVTELVRQSLAAVEGRLVAVLNPLVRKRVAASLLGISVQALDKWIAKGEVVTEPIGDGASRRAIPLLELVELAVEVETARHAAAPGAHFVSIAVAQRERRRGLSLEMQGMNNLTKAIHSMRAAAIEQGKVS